MRPFQAALDTCLDSPLLCQPLSSRFALHGLRALETTNENPGICFRIRFRNGKAHESPRFAFAGIKLGTHKPQQQATLAKES